MDLAEHRDREQDALWDPGRPLPEDLERLSGDLARLPLPPAPDWGRVRPTVERPWRPSVPFVWAAAAGFVALLVGQWLVRDAWPVHPLEGRAGWRGPTLAGRLPLGSACQTDGRSRVRIDVGGLGQVVLEPGGLLRRLPAGHGETRLSLVHGTLHARISAPPRRFIVETSAGAAVDLGCAYSLSVDREGTGLLHVTEGRVTFSDHGRESFIPAGTWCPIRPEGAGVPRRDYATDGFLALLANYDRPDCAAGTLDTLLAAAEASDALSLWHLLPRVDGTRRAQVVLRLAELVGEPPGAPRERVLALDPIALDAWWSALGMGDAEEWRTGVAWKGDAAR
jgi:hypothetical protein